MRSLVSSLYFLPVTFFAGQDGFMLFAPYLGVFLAVAHFLKAHRVRQSVIQRSAATKDLLAVANVSASPG